MDLTLNKKIDRLREEYYFDFRRFAADCLVVRTKTDGVKPFILNSVQLDFLHRFNEQMRIKKRARFIILKARQQGLSTLIEGLMYWWSIYHAGFKGLVLTHLDSATQELFEITRRYHQNTPQPFKPNATSDSSHELTFRGIDSAIKTATAGSPNAGHGSTYQGLHWSEVSRSRNQASMVSGVVQTVPDGDGTMIFYESTANGIGEYFHQTWQEAIRGENDYEPVFYAWFDSVEYRKDPTGFEFSSDEREYQNLYGIDDAQLAWRQWTLKNKMEGSPEARLSMFAETYPSNSDEAFQSDTNSFIDPVSVEKAFESEHEPIGAIVMGVDPARKGKDSSGIAIRQGRKVLFMARWRIEDTMLLASRVAGLIDKYSIDGVFVDVVGLGAGVYDRLKELGYGSVCHEAIAGARADKNEKYKNKRAEMWAGMSDWLDAGADLPSNEVLRSDLLMLGFDFDSSNRLILQSKKNMAASPDLGDALAMTFYAHVAPKAEQSKEYAGHKKRRTDGGNSIEVRV